MNFLDLIKQREAFSEKGQGALEQRVKALQGALYSLLLEKIVANLETDEVGQIKFTISNIRTAGQLTTVWAAHQKSTNVFVKWIVEQLIKLFDLNTLYAREVAKVVESQEVKARKLLLYNLGWDIDKNAIIKDSWLANLAGQDSLKQQIANRIATAIQSKISLKKFRDDFKADFLNVKGSGWVDRYFAAKSQDLFQQFDRSTQEVYRQELKLEFAIYSGTIQQPTKDSAGTREFCWTRVNNLYDLETVNEWNSLDWSGRIEGSDVKITAGGHRCRHHFSWVSKEMAETLQKRGRTLNKYNPPKPKVTKK